MKPGVIVLQSRGANSANNLSKRDKSTKEGPHLKGAVALIGSSHSETTKFAKTDLCTEVSKGSKGKGATNWVMELKSPPKLELIPIPKTPPGSCKLCYLVFKDLSLHPCCTRRNWATAG